MLVEKSAGAVLFYRGESVEYLLLLSTYWGFPKGQIEPAEDEKDAALREIREETGLAVTLVDGFRHVDDYWYQRRGRRIHKEAIYFLAEASSRNSKLSWEHEEMDWLSYEAAFKKLKFKGLRELLTQADELIRKER